MTAVVIGGQLGVGREYRAPRRARIIAALAVIYVGIVGGFIVVRSMQMETVVRIGEAAAAMGMVIPGFCMCVALLGFLIRSARLRIDGDGIHWGWGGFGFTMRATSLRTARAYRNAIALHPKRGFTTWYLGAGDWHPFPEVVAGLRRSGLPFEIEDRRAPLRAIFQSYGITLDLLLIMDIIGITGLLLVL